MTHALIGTASAAGLFSSQPALAVGLVLGNVAPDLDALSRIAGKHAFLRFHQTYTHSAGAIAVVLAVSGGLLIAGLAIWAQLAIGLAIGMMMHVGLDLTNSYGVKCLWPLSQRRFAMDWIFFIDAYVIALCAMMLALQFVFRSKEDVVTGLSIAFVAMLLFYVGLRRGIAAGAKRRLGSANALSASTSVIPTTGALFRFLVCRKTDGFAETFTFDARSGTETERRVVPILDEDVPAAIIGCREWTVMRSLSDFYFCVEIDGNTYVGEDLRIRNFGTHFGRLECQLGAEGELEKKRWDV